MLDRDGFDGRDPIWAVLESLHDLVWSARSSKGYRPLQIDIRGCLKWTVLAGVKCIDGFFRGVYRCGKVGIYDSSFTPTL